MLSSWCWSLAVCFTFVQLVSSSVNESTTSTQPQSNVKGTFVLLIKDSINIAKKTIQKLDLQFNAKYRYPIQVFYEELTSEQQEELAQASEGNISYHKVVFDIPSHIPAESVPEKIPPYSKAGIGYRHMCRFFAGLIFREPALQEFDYMWRIDDDSDYLCPIDYDPFAVMQKGKYLYGYLQLFFERPERAPLTLWEATKQYFKEKGIKPDHIEEFVNMWGQYDRVHYWNNFEIVDLRFFRSSTYMDYFDYLDKIGGWYYDRWGDALARTLAVGSFMRKDRVHRFDDIGYMHYEYCRNPCNAPTNPSPCDSCPDSYCGPTHPYHFVRLSGHFISQTKLSIIVWLMFICACGVPSYLLLRRRIAVLLNRTRWFKRRRFADV